MVSLINGIVLEIHQTGENDFLVSFFTSNGLLTLYTQGLNKQTSKNRNNLQIGSIVEIEYFKARLKDKIGRMKKVNLLVNISLIDIKINLFVSNIVKLFKNIKQKNHLYNEYLTHIKKINQDNVDLFLAYFYAQSTTYFGVQPSFNKCRTCFSNKNLVDFSIIEGGFICSKHSNIIYKSNDELILFWSLYFNIDKLLMNGYFNQIHTWINELKYLIKNAGYYV
ncbi:DNA repair protein RecO [Mycoplasmopsis felis]|uniref:DNA repair protein RecO n=1 Tax=Mycoplasmopsis felis TaxID=33923 RepID=UPI002AFEA36E|nr:DNA repair protein RecO [Mycoplasmopsis felis]WQQ07665.1 DNA repair protein RecO [Mycoplasmopsis felis]